MCRLVKGAYWDSEIKRGAGNGPAGVPVFTHKHHSDSSYLACAASLLNKRTRSFRQFATHNAGTIAAIVQMAKRFDAPFELQRLHGMGSGVYRELFARAPSRPRRRCVYAPVGSHRRSARYLVRRLLEKRRQFVIRASACRRCGTCQELLASPLHVTETAIPLPRDILAPRRNSDGVDLTVETMRAPLLAAFATTQINRPLMPRPSKLAPPCSAPTRPLRLAQTPPWRARRECAHTTDAPESELPLRAAGEGSVQDLGATPLPSARGDRLLRYYADEAERVCARSRCLARPARATPFTRAVVAPGSASVRGISAGDLHGPGRGGSGDRQHGRCQARRADAGGCAGSGQVAARRRHSHRCAADVTGFGETVRRDLVAHAQVAGVVFTGSTQVAKIIQRSLAAKDGPIVPLIAGRRHQRDAGRFTALPEHVADAVVQSAFRSAGQRCSALRLLCVHEEIADHVVTMLRGAMKELVVGDTASLATDVGPLIDQGVRWHSRAC